MTNRNYLDLYLRLEEIEVLRDSIDNVSKFISKIIRKNKPRLIDAYFSYKQSR